ncbi:hypothetical protein TEA_006463 [Camellia sinensis var. sinensis]|uniref:Uncharacterized protein n=1 Tax=Camellia sinensis var. sinensis TaxID=542762 RepID=A0A4S4F1Q1_CAMSN|nr:hypothetical protein TEA_006463 [Camellia sinensis var. sinensis]
MDRYTGGSEIHSRIIRFPIRIGLNPIHGAIQFRYSRAISISNLQRQHRLHRLDFSDFDFDFDFEAPPPPPSAPARYRFLCLSQALPPVSLDLVIEIEIVTKNYEIEIDRSVIPIKPKSKHIWIDHCSLCDYDDGLIDITRESTDITISRYGKVFKSHLFGSPTIVSTDAEVESMICGREVNPDLVQVEKAKAILMEHEVAILEVLAKLADVSDGDDSPKQFQYHDSQKELQRIGRGMATQKDLTVTFGLKASAYPNTDLDRSAGVQVASSATTSKRRRNDLNDNDYDAAERPSGSPGIDDQEDLLHLNSKRLRVVMVLRDVESRRLENMNGLVLCLKMNGFVLCRRMQSSSFHIKYKRFSSLTLQEVPDITTALMDAKLGTEGRKDLFDWLSRQLSGLSNFPNADKSADVRKAAEVCIGEIFRVCGPDAVTKNLKDIQGPALAIVLERLKHSGAFQETFEVAKTISMGPSLKSGSKVRKSGSKVHEPDEHPPQYIS